MEKQRLSVLPFLTLSDLLSELFFKLMVLIQEVQEQITFGFWTVVFICLTLAGIIYDKFISTAKKKFVKRIPIYREVEQSDKS